MSVPDIAYHARRQIGEVTWQAISGLVLRAGSPERGRRGGGKGEGEEEGEGRGGREREGGEGERGGKEKEEVEEGMGKVSTFQVTNEVPKGSNGRI
eukprot:1060260-Rhodomonas_salina.2